MDIRLTSTEKGTPRRLYDRFQSLFSQQDVSPFAILENSESEQRLIDVLKHEAVPQSTVVIESSGSSGSRRFTVLPLSALRASIDATYDRIGPPGQWLCALPVHHIAGAQVIARAALHNQRLVIMDSSASFTAVSFLDACATLDRTSTSYTSLVPTQLQRLITASKTNPDVVDALRSFNAILLGGARIDPTLTDWASTMDIAIVTTYGMTETCGGCVYDGIPLQGVQIDISPSEEVIVTSPVVGLGYLSQPPFETVGNSRVFRTRDRGVLRDGTLSILGRLDDVIISGAENVSLHDVEEVARPLVTPCEVVAIGIPDDQWGESVVLVVENTDMSSSGFIDMDSLNAGRISEAIVAECGRAARPVRIVVTTSLPRIGPGKVDRNQLKRSVLDQL